MMNQLLGDKEHSQQALADIFERHGVVLAYLYGSQARGDVGSISDVDIAVQFGPDVSSEERFQRVLWLMVKLGNLLGRDDVQVIDLAEASPLLRHRVYYDGKLLHCTDDAERVRFATTALRDYVDTEPLRRIKRHYVLQRLERD